MVKAGSETEGEQKIAPVYLVFEGEIVLDAPVKSAWPHVINYPSWQSYDKVERVSGEPGREGEVVLLHKEEDGYQFPPYHAITIKLEPERVVIWKVYLEKSAQEFDFFGIVRFSVHDAGNNKTRFCYDTIYEFQVPHREKSELIAFQREQHDNMTALFKAVLPKLQQLVASKA